MNSAAKVPEKNARTVVAARAKDRAAGFGVIRDELYRRRTKPACKTQDLVRDNGITLLSQQFLRPLHR
jgi:hypothetical protein